MNTVVWEFEHSLALPFFGIGVKTDLSQSCGHCWVLQICWHIECSTFTSSSFEVWNSSAGIPSPPLAFFIVMFPKAHLTSHSRMSGSRWVTTSSWISRSLRLFCILFLCILATFSKSLLLGPYDFCPLLCWSLHEIFPWFSNFPEEISSLSHSVVFLCFFALFTYEGFLLSRCFLELCSILLGISFPFSFAFPFSPFLSYL